MRQRTPRLLDPAFLVFVRTKPCCICGRPAEAAHIRMACIERDKRHAGIGERPDDKWSTPLCPDHHRNGRKSQHEIGNEWEFWQGHGLDPFDIAAKLYAEFAAIRKTPPPEPVLIRKRKRQRITTTRVLIATGAKRSWPSRPFPPGRGFQPRRQ